jgi:nucleoid-associated protein YgaU
MADKKSVFARLGSLLKKKNSESNSGADVTVSNQNQPVGQPDLIESKLAEADHDMSDFTTGLIIRQSPIASSQHLKLNGDRFIAAHVVGFKDTLSGIAYKYYGKASEPYYLLIYEANQETIGTNINLLRAGKTLNIPRLPEDLSKD